ncbi:PQ-loop repeat [uncultured Caudovirales phage]|uniref:PQ-loop repeat n=1 Tax=uncultured Caudovirales phage TaxID=2100421 RepID=A0A6J7X7D0_9CAUD|nr:PQ-loop repeat [uncultured Caudovirales phage]
MTIKDIVREVSGSIMSLCCLVCSIPQIYKILKTKHSADLAPASILISFTCGVSGMIYVLTSTYSFWLFLNCVNGIVLSTILFCCWYRYK